MNDAHSRYENVSIERRALLTIKHMQRELETLQQAKTEPIAIVGMSCRFPGGANSPEAFWQLLVEGRDAITEIPAERYDINAYYDPDSNAPGKTVSRWGGFLDGIDQFDPLFFGISPREAAEIDPQQRLLLEVGWEAMERAGLLPEKLFGSRTGVFIGIFNHDYSDMMHERMMLENAFNATPYTATGSGASFAAGRLSYLLGLQGPSMIIDTVCSSSLVAVHLACQSLRNNECTTAFAGATNLVCYPMSTIIMSKMRALSPSGRSKTFDASADGFVRGEGCAMVLLKRLSQARADGDSILAVIRGSAVNHDGRSSGLTAPNGLAQQAVIQQALESARVSPAQISYVETHGTGTALGDPIEFDALKAVIGQPRPDGLECVLGSVKTNIGHLEACAGMAGLIKTVLSMQHEMLPPLLHLKTLNPHIALENTPFVLPTSLRTWPVGAGRKFAGVSGAGLSGTNAHIVLEEAPDRPHSDVVQGDDAAYMLPLSARDPEALRQLALIYQHALTASDSTLAVASLRDICCTASMRRTHYPYRIGVVGQNHKELASRLAAFVGEKQGPEPASETMPGPVFLFAGQGTQWIGMGRQLYEREPLFKATIDTCDSLLRPHVAWSLVEELRADEQHSRLHTTEVAQVALFAIQVALATLWRSWGIIPGAVVGHSVGEIAAAHVAGVLSLEQAVRIVAMRGRLMQATHGLGKMVAVEISEGEARSILADYTGRLSIAAVNSPTHVVFSGERAALEEVLRLFESEGIFFRTVQEDYAFHSVQIEQCRAPFMQALKGLKPSRATIPLISTVTGEQSSGEEYDAAYWARNMCEEVRFGPAIEELIAMGHRTFLEISPRPALAQPTIACLEYHAKNGRVLPSCKPGSDELAIMLTSLGVLYAQGYAVQWEQVYAVAEQPYAVVTLPTYQWQRKRYWHPEKKAPSRRSWSASGQAQQHPLLGQRVRSALKGTVFETIIDTNVLPWLNDHRVYETVVFPASAYVEMLLVTARAALKTESIQLHDLVFHQALTLPPERSQVVQTIFHSAPDKTSATVQVFSCPANEDNEQEQWILHASGNVSVQHDLVTPAVEHPVLADVQARCLEKVEGQQHYQHMRAMGMQYGISFQGVRQLWRRDGEAIASLVLPSQLEEESKKYTLHPVLLDACLQVVTACLAKESDAHESIYLPFSIESIHFSLQAQKSIWCHVQMRSEAVAPGTMLVADIWLLDQHGHCIAEVRGLHLRQASYEALMFPAQQRTQRWLYEMSWEQQARAVASAHPATHEGTWLIFCDRSGVGRELARRWQERGERCLLVFAEHAGASEPGLHPSRGTSQERGRGGTLRAPVSPTRISLGGGRTQGAAPTPFPSEGRIPSELSDYASVDPSNVIQFQQLLEQHFSDERLCRGIIHLWSLDAVETDQAGIADLEASQRLICGSVLHIVQVVAQRAWVYHPHLSIITRGSQTVSAGERDQALAQAPVWGLGRVIAKEQPDFHCKQIDLDRTEDTSEAIDALLQELLMPGNEDQVAFRTSKRYVARLVRSAFAGQGNASLSTVLPSFRADSSYLITGGCGGLGLAVARWMVEQGGVKNLVLVSRGGASAAARAVMNELEQAGARVVVIRADVAQEDQVAQMLATVQETMPPLRGIIHAAGVLDDGTLLQQNWARFEKVMAPKIQGSWNLHRLTHALDFFVLFSSGASLLGSAGQGNYAAANAFMDALAHYRKAQGLAATSINWGAWAEVGMAAASTPIERRLAKDGMQSIGLAQGMEILAQLLQDSPAQIGVLPIDWAKFAKQFASNGSPTFFKNLLDEVPTRIQEVNNLEEDDLLRTLQAAPVSEQFSLLQHVVDQTVRRALGLDADFTLEPGQDLFAIGMDSLSAIEVRNRFQAMLQGTKALPANFIFEHPSVAKMTTYLAAIVLKVDAGTLGEGAEKKQ